MEQSFEYLRVSTAMDSITVDDIAEVILEANNDMELYWYLYIHTDGGESIIKEFGPLFRDDTVSKFGFDFNIAKMNYDENKISKRISLFLNNPKREITQVMAIDESDFEEKLRRAKSLL